MLQESVRSCSNHGIGAEMITDFQRAVVGDESRNPFASQGALAGRPGCGAADRAKMNHGIAA